MPFRNRRFSVGHVQVPSGGVKNISKVLTKAALLAIESIVKEHGGDFVIVERRETETIFRVSPDITSLMIRKRLSKMGLKPEIRMVIDPR